MPAWFLAGLIVLLPSVVAVLWLIWRTNALAASNIEMFSNEDCQS